ncbi:MAG TPA: glycoside hydrolase family 3 N-terminal domain-containing protein [Solirubrobacteraceae bacterium]|nr:glycoside hydrolase family 3 N-terminal domain-containing protein [Solirubrobacteraceae bacterium]
MGSRPSVPVVALLLTAALMTAAVMAARTASSTGGRATATPTAVARTAAVQKLTADELAGQRIIYAYAGLRPPASLLAAIRAGEAGGVIFFGSNVSSLSQIRSVIAQLQRASLASPVHTRLLMLTDQEGGEVRRLPGAPSLSEKQIGQSRAGASLARAAGAGAAHVLTGVGMNVNLAPVVDVYRRSGNFIDEFQRSYSSAPSTVAALSAAFIAAQQRLGVAATAKHFPGLGAAAQSQNTDGRPVTLGLTAATLRSVDEAPYRSAIAAGVRLVMTSWAVYPALDPFRPAGLSPTVIQGELRRRLGFRGVTITDGIDAGAVTPYGSLTRRSVLAADAGADLILCAAVNPAANTPAQGITAMHAIAAAITSRAISLASAQQAAARILNLRSHP